MIVRYFSFDLAKVECVETKKKKAVTKKIMKRFIGLVYRSIGEFWIIKQNNKPTLRFCFVTLCAYGVFCIASTLD